MFHVARRELERKLMGKSQNSFESATYIGGSVAFKRAVVDLHICTGLSINSSALKISCPRRESERNFEIVLLAEKAITALDFTYRIASLIALENAVMDLHIGTIDPNGSTLRVPCPAPGRREEISKKTLQTVAIYLHWRRCCF
jgi:hypothetical protein